jgi:SAM-dependent methyltransferase
MFWDDIKLVTEQVEKYGLRSPFVDLGGMERPCIADYDQTIATKDQNARYVSLKQRPFDHIDVNYIVLNPENGDPDIEDLPYTCCDTFGTAVCLNVIEHVRNPFRVFGAFYQIMKQDSLLIIETVFSFPYHPSPIDYWRYSPDCLHYLAENAGFKVLEAGWRMTILADQGVRTTAKGVDEPQEIRSVYVTLAKGGFMPRPGENYPLPQRFSNATVGSAV